ncbi:MAG TPA: LptF/LptG family permease, partial [Waddliaceae bacterium]
MAYDLSSVNPILLLQSAKIARLQDAFIQMDPVRNVEVAQNLVIALNNRSGKRLNLCIAKQIEMEGDKLLAKHVSIISSAPAENSFDHLVIENQQLMTSSAPEIVKLLHKTGWRIANDHLTFSLLRIRTKLLQEQVALYHKQAHSPETQCVPARGIDEKAIRNLSKCYTEYVRRFSVGLSTFTFTLLGIAFGITIGRNRTKRDILIVLGISACCLIAFCLGKELAHLFWIASLFFLLPHALIILASLWSIRKVQRGIE